ncbi:hypothetical protein RSOL_508220, partial [Rhizoctonia solani AG-3 Rhs1AP]
MLAASFEQTHIFPERSGGGFRGKAIPEDFTGRTLFTSNPGAGSYDTAAGSSKPFGGNRDAPRAEGVPHRVEVFGERSQLRVREHKFVPHPSSNRQQQLNVWSDRAKLNRIEFTTTPVHFDTLITPTRDLLWQAIPTFPAITQMYPGVVYGEYAPLNDDAVIGRGRSRKEAVEDSARKLLELDYCYY